MSERRLKTKKLRKRREPTGRAVRLSNALLDFIEPRRKGIRSYDAFLRRHFGLPAWDGTEQPLVEGCLEVTTGQFFLKKESWDQAETDAMEEAIFAAAKAKTKKVNKPIRMREIA